MVESRREQLDLEDLASPRKTYSNVGHPRNLQEGFRIQATALTSVRKWLSMHQVPIATQTEGQSAGLSGSASTCRLWHRCYTEIFATRMT